MKKHIFLFFSMLIAMITIVGCSNSNPNNHEHHYSVEWEWGEDVRAIFSCECGEDPTKLLANTTIEKIKGPTCMEEGIEKIKAKVMFKNELYEETHENKIDALGHDLVTHSKKDDTCTEDGWTEYQTCTRCDYSTYEIIKCSGHNIVDTVLNPSCTEDGYTLHECTKCDYSYKDSYVKDLGHDYTNGVTVTNPGPATEGFTLHECSKCDYSYKDNYTSPTLILTLVDDYYEISSVGNCTDSYIEIPSTYKGLPIKSIGEKAFYQCETIQEISLPDSIISIGDRAFSYCTNLERINLSNNLKTIGNNGFCGCKKLEYLYLPNTLTYVGQYGFSSCYRLTICCDNVSTSGWGSYYNNNNRGFYTNCDKDNYFKYDGLRYIIHNNTAIVVGFEDTTTNIDIPNSVSFKGKTYNVTKIGDNAFYIGTNNKIITSVIMGDNIVEIGRSAFSMCELITDIKFSNNLKTIGQSAFNYNNSLTEINLPASLESIEEAAFISCQYVGNVFIPKSVKTIGSMAFIQGCRVIHCEVASKPSGWSSDWIESNNIVYWGKNTNYTIKDGIYYSINGTEAKVSGTDNSVGNVNIASNVTINGKSYKVTSIANYAFFRNVSIKSIVVPFSIKLIEKYSFYKCVNIEKMTLPFVGSEADHSSNNYFGYIFGAESYSSNNSYVPESLKEVIITGSTKLEEAFIYCRNIQKIIIQGNIISISSNAFGSCDNLEEVVLPNTVQSIKQYAFSDCPKLKKVIIPASVTSMSYYVFKNSDNVTIYCRASSQPSSWDSSWNYYNRPVVWGYTGN